ncbi:uncharacterized protein [Asterias amurensis]|uniref:uncharacterized protein n=1 Tax=Asterias amurensis TaxID=7602 RepID=UPI003AB81BA0
MRVDTDVIFDNKNKFDFPAIIPKNIANPQLLKVDNWKGGVRVKVLAYDDDTIGKDDIGEFDQNITIESSSSVDAATWRDYTIKIDKSEFLYKVKIYCNANFYTSDCGVYCKPRDNTQGHYGCNQTTGAKMCHDGWEGSDCTIDTDECASGPCHNGATCVDNVNGFSCVCNDGWSGLQCDVEIDECESAPCKNGATCDDFMNYFNCSCVPGFVYVDEFCEMDECSDNPCLNGSTCHDLTGNFSCSCAPGFEGKTCSVDINECISSPCQNGGNCTEGIDWFNCTCLPGFEGNTCQINIDECESNPCHNNATCLDGIDGYTCNCPIGYNGTLCQIEINECESNPCQNDATCLDLVGYFQCDCSQGYFGDLCEVDIDYCINQTCQNNGTCVDRLDGFHCVCQAGFEGDMCDTEIDECASNPCMFNSTCQDLIAGFRCTCQPGYDGTFCQNDTNECLSDPCTNNATCIDDIAEFRCRCLPGFGGTLCEVNIDECSSYPCFDNETCLDQTNGYRCIDGVNMCEDDPPVCKNNATCFDEDRGFSCQCKDGFHGNACQFDTDECQSSPCVHGNCTDLINGFSCQCFPGAEGTLCEVDLDECASIPCWYGTCADELNGFSCLCSAGYEGSVCQYEIDECESSPCMMNGTCADLIDGFSCDCPTGYGGEQCGEETDECRSSPCIHGICQDEFNGYKCVCERECLKGHCDNGVCDCDPGYEGDDCSVQIDYCLSSPCSQGTCIALENAFRCECDAFHTGEYCTDLIDDPCSLNQCEHGQCVPSSDAPNGYNCTCNEGYFGANCKIDLRKFGSVVMLFGRTNEARDFEKNMATLLLKELPPMSARDKREFTVTVVSMESYVTSDKREPLTKVTYVTRSLSGYVDKNLVEDTISETPSDTLIQSIGYDKYTGKAVPQASTGDGGKSWVEENWFVFLIALAVVAVAGIGGFAFWRKRRTPSSGLKLESEILSSNDRNEEGSNDYIQLEGDNEYGGTLVDNPLYESSEQKTWASETET